MPTAVKPSVLAHLVDDIVIRQHNHTTSGIVGWKCTLEVLAREGLVEVALAVLQNDSYPSIGYMLKGGANGYEPATTLWELWDADVQGPGMNSRNHIMFGSVGGWLYKSLAGITPLAPGYARADVRPRGIGVRNLSHLNASVATPHGEITLSWRLVSAASATSAAAPPAQLSLALRLPAGVAARVAIPLLSTITEAGSGSQSFSPAGQPRGRLWEAGSLVWSRGAFVAGVRGISTTEATRGGVVELEVASGSYQFMLTQ